MVCYRKYPLRINGFIAAHAARAGTAAEENRKEELSGGWSEEIGVKRPGASEAGRRLLGMRRSRRRASWQFQALGFP